MGPVGGRFVIERDAGAGGMARVYRARDLSSDRVVALKILTRMEETDLRRFTREVNVLSELRDAAIPSYIAHGFTEAGEPYLAMEWLDGESLDATLSRGPLSVTHALELGRAIASGLAAAHARGIIHRDVKPGNVFLVGCEPARAKLIDFGIARQTLATLGVTTSGDLLGTPLYMSPEQARGELDLDPRVDVYALGALLFAALAGKPTFIASTLVALLAKIVVEEAPSLAVHAAEIPPALDALVARMLAKHRDERPADAGVVARELAALRDGLGEATARPTLASAKEQRVVSILLASGVERASALNATVDATIDARGSGTLALADGSVFVTFTGPESPSDLAARAVRYALGVRSPSAAIALATGRAVISGGAPVGEVIDRAGRQLALATGVVRIDEDTAGLVEGRFELEHDAMGAKVIAERGEADSVRTLLGKPTRCVGRDRELAAIEGHYAEVVGESVARVVLVYADAGVGKSRFAREAMRRLAGRDDAPFMVLVRGEPQSATTPLAAVAAGVRHILARSAIHQANEFLVELAGLSTGPVSEKMRAARESPLLMFEQIRDTWTHWLREACANRAHVIVIEDLQWIDTHSILLLDAALGALGELPLFVVALGRPEARTLSRWATRKPHEVRLDPLPRRASERLVREALVDASDTVVGEIVSRAGGNALFLEELVRAFSQSVASLPVGVIGTVQLRLDSVRPEARAALRAASVFGERFQTAGVAALLGRPDVGAVLDELVTHELIARTADDELVFRHALVREAAYALLTEDDRRLAHGLAAEYLEHLRGHPPENVAQHYQLAKRNEQAATWYVRASEHSLHRNDLAGAITLAKRALAFTTQSNVRGRAEHLIAESEMWRANLQAARTSATRAVENLSPGTVEWFEAAGMVITTAGQLGDNDTVAMWLDRAMAHEPTGDAVSPYAICLARATSQLVLADRGPETVQAMERLEALRNDDRLSPHARARVTMARGYSNLLRGAMDVCIAHLAEAATIYESVGSKRDVLLADVMRGTILAFSGALDEAREICARVEQDAGRLEAHYIANWARSQLGFIASAGGDRALANQYSSGTDHITSPLFVGGGSVIRGWFAITERDFDQLDQVLARARTVQLPARYIAVLDIYTARARQLRGDTTIEQTIRSALDVLDRCTIPSDVHIAGISIALEALLDLGAPDARALVANQQARLRETAAAFVDPVRGQQFLTNLRWLRRVFEL